MVGVSGRIIARSTPRGFSKAFIREAAKWVATLAFALWFVVTFRPSKALYLLLMRRNITKGLLSK
jgi:hypothetical protein